MFLTRNAKITKTLTLGDVLWSLQSKSTVTVPTYYLAPVCQKRRERPTREKKWAKWLQTTNKDAVKHGFSYVKVMYWSFLVLSLRWMFSALVRVRVVKWKGFTENLSSVTSISQLPLQLISINIHISCNFIIRCCCFTLSLVEKFLKSQAGTII